MPRWAIAIDIEGFSATFETSSQALTSLGALAGAIYALGSLSYPESPNRLFAHQLGDGFVVVGEFGRLSLEVPISITIALMRSVLRAGGVAKASLAEGGFSDITSCFPEAIGFAMRQGTSFPLGRGVMTVLPVMGTALIRAFGIAKRSPSGSLVTMSSELAARVPEGLKASILDGGLVAVDWIHARTEELERIQQTLGLSVLSIGDWERALRSYLRDGSLTPDWKSNTLKCNCLPRECGAP